MSIYFETGYAKTAALVAIPDPVTVCFWLYVKAWQADRNRLFGSESNFEIYIDSINKKVYNELFMNGGDASTTALSLNTWYHIACSGRKSDGCGELFINGNMEATSFGHTDSYTTPNYLAIGNRNGSAAGDMSNAIFEDVRLYSGKLSDKQVFEIFKTGIINFLPGTGTPKLLYSWIRHTLGDTSLIGAEDITDEHGKTATATVPSGNAYYYPSRIKIRK
jgi:hypothetical protein